MRTTLGGNSIAQRLSVSPSVMGGAKTPINFLWSGLRY
jgi:hypothetical protein